jgi:hypothetical protein
MQELPFFVALNQVHVPQIFKWCEIVAGVTPTKFARYPQVRLPFAAMALNIRNRVSSANAFDMFSIHFVSITVTHRGRSGPFAVCPIS